MPEVILRKEAREQGLTAYFTGKPCKNGHLEERNTHSGICYGCQKKNNKKYFSSVKGKEAIKKFNQSDAKKKAQLKYKDTEKGRDAIRKGNNKYKKTEKGRIVQNKVNLKYVYSKPERIISKNLRTYIGNTLKKEMKKKSLKFKETVGCNEIELKKHLEEKFLPKMSWDNYGDWHIDHIIPINYFKKFYDFNDKRVQKICWHYENLQPMWASDNIAKSNKVDEEYAEDLIEYIQSKMSKSKGNEFPNDYNPYDDPDLMEFVEAFKKSGITSEDLKDGTFELEKEQDKIKLKEKKDD